MKENEHFLSNIIGNKIRITYYKTKESSCLKYFIINFIIEL